MKGTRNRKVWPCRQCKTVHYSWRAWSSHLWDKHHIALLRKVKRRKIIEQTSNTPSEVDRSLVR